MELKEKINDLPKSSGVYIMKDEYKNVLYVGKAKNLRNRVRQYFHGNNHTEKTMVLVSKIKDIHYILTPTELDALVLENNLIKKYRPPYNILLKDDKTYPYIKINIRNPFPTIEITRKLKADGARYFGPYMLGLSAYDITELLQSAFPIRSCKGSLKNIKRECLDYHIGRCLAPCTGKINEEEYKELIKKVISFLSGNNIEVQKSLEEKMYKAANEQEFESAKYYRDLLETLKKVVRKQTIPFKLELDLDIFSYVTNGLIAVVNITIVRNGKLLGSQSFSLNDTTKENALSSYIMSYYEKNPILCNEIVVSEELDFETELNDYLSYKANRKLNIIYPIGGLRKQIVDISMNNAIDYLEKQSKIILQKEDLTLGAVKQLQEYLDLKNEPIRIECYDISNISGTDKVSSMVVFLNGEAAKNHYRHFKIKTVKGANDFASMKETLLRRLARLKKEDEEDISFSEKPDLVVVDGGKGQLSSALEAIEETGVNVIIISLAKREEEVFVPYKKESIMLPRDSLALKLLVRIRDESHRFAINYHRKLRIKGQTLSELKMIDGVGNEKAKELLIYFKDIKRIKSATTDELSKAKGISKIIAKNIYDFYNKH